MTNFEEIVHNILLNVSCAISGGCPYPRMNGHKIAQMLQEGYRMAKPDHVDQRLYVYNYICYNHAGVEINFFDHFEQYILDITMEHSNIAEK